MDGILHYKGRDGLRQVVIDQKTKRKIMEACHDDKVGGCHFGETWVCLLYFSVALLILMFILYCIYVGEICEVCQGTKRKFNKPASSLHPIPVSNTWNKVGIDLIELPVSKNGN